MIDAGRLRHEVRIDSLDYVRDTSGDVVQDEYGATQREWRCVATIRAEIVMSSVRDLIQSRAAQSKIAGRIVTRYRDDVTAGMRATHVRFGRDHSQWRIEGAIPDPDSGLEYMTLPVSAWEPAP